MKTACNRSAWAVASIGALFCFTVAHGDTSPPAATADDQLTRENAPAAEKSPEEPPPIGPEALEAAGFIIGDIAISNGDVFDADLPEENNRLFRLANKLHLETRPGVIRSQLLFRTGDRYSARLISESERILRSNNYLFDAKITAVRVRGDKVDIMVRTRDVWTLKPGISFGRSGGENSTGFEFEESNLLGRGKEFELAYIKDVDRETKRVSYFDPHLAGTWNRLEAQYENNSDGELRDFSFDRPFYSLEAHWTAGVGFRDWKRIDSRYNLGEVVDRFRHVEEQAEIFGGWSTGLTNNRVRRLVLGAAYQHHGFESVTDPLSAAVLPRNRTLAYPYVDIGFLQDAFEERRNQDQIERTEDFYAGAFLTARVGYAAEALGSDRDAVILGLRVGTAFENEQRKHTLLLEAEGEARIEDGEPRNAMLTTRARYYWRTAARQLFYASLSGTAGNNLDADQQILLGGDNGLRGYPLRYQDGSARALLTLEHRLYTRYYLFRLFHIGGAVFFDAGRAWGQGTVSDPTEKWLKDAGVGLRLGSSRSSFGSVIHIDLALPFDGDATIDEVQFLVETKRSF